MKKILSSLLIMFVFLLGANNVFALDVSQVSLNVEDKSSTITVIDEGIGTLGVNPKIEFNEVGDFITYKLVLKNNDGKKYKVESVTDNNTNEHIKVEYDYNQDMNTDNKTILITLKYDKKITDPSTELKSIKVSIKLIDEDDNTQNIGGGSNTDPSGNNSGGSTNNNSDSPQTGDSIKTHVWWLFISLIGLILSIVYIVKNKGKKYNKGLLSILLLLTLIPTIVFASEVKEIVFNINFENIKINIKHKVSFDTEGGNAIDTQTIDNNEKATKPEDPTKEHYNFVKWLDEENREFDFTTPITKDVKLSALWEAKEYTISYNYDGGSSVANETKKYNETFTRPSNPTKEHYNFVKWVDENNEEYDFSTKATRNITLTAVWDKEEYTIAFETNGGTPKPEDQKVLYKDKVTKPSNPTKNKHDFDGWLDEQGNLYNFDSEVTKNMTLTAKWTELFTVTYEPNGGTPKPKDQTVRKNGKFNEPQKPSKDHYNFERWYIDATFTTHYDFNEEVTSDKKLYAKYTPKEYTITYKLNGGNVSTPNKDKYTIETDDFTLNKPTKDKAVFKGWKKNNETTVNENVTITKGTTGNLEFEAIFNPIYIVTYDVNGGNAITPTSKQIENGEEIGNLQIPTKDHYDFAGWYIRNTKIDENYKVESDITLVAKYTPKEYTITYKLNGGIVATANPTTYTIETPDFTLNNPTPPNDKRFKGWKKNNETTVNENVTITKGTTGNLEFEAIYKTLFTVTFDADIGTIPISDATREVESGSKLGTLPTPTPPTGKVLEGWYIETTLIDSNYTVNKDVTIKAKYKDVANVTDLVDPDDPEVITDDYGNDRFTGFDPKNYIYYNCKTEPTSSWTDNDYKNSCELWRILGTFDNVEDAQGKKEKRAKIIRDDYLPGNYAWDSSASNINSGGGINEWSQADLMYELNGDYLDYTKTGTTTWYNGSKNKKTEPYDYKYSLSRYAQTLIKEADWWYGYTNIYNGGFSFPIMNTQQRKFMKVARVYELERTEYNVKDKTGATYDSLARGTKIFKVVGLPSLSDYGYATSGDNDESIRLGCLNSDLEYDYGVFSGKKCHMYNWLHNGTKAVWTINRLYDFPAPQNTGVWAIATRGGIISYPASGSMVSSTTYEFYVRPTVFLKKNVVAIGGTGTKTDPYKITLMD